VLNDNTIFIFVSPLLVCPRPSSKSQTRNNKLHQTCCIIMLQPSMRSQRSVSFFERKRIQMVGRRNLWWKVVVVMVMGMFVGIVVLRSNHMVNDSSPKTFQGTIALTTWPRMSHSTQWCRPSRNLRDSFT